MTGTIAWLEGKWGAPHELRLPLNDRGLQLADGLFETVLIQDGEPRLLEDHLQRWATSANLLGMASPPERSHLQPLIKEATLRCGLQRGSGYSTQLEPRGSRAAGDRRASTGTASLLDDTRPGEPTFSGVTAIICRQERRNADSLISDAKPCLQPGGSGASEANSRVR